MWTSPANRALRRLSRQPIARSTGPAASRTQAVNKGVTTAEVKVKLDTGDWTAGFCIWTQLRDHLQHLRSAISLRDDTTAAEFPCLTR